MRLISLDVLRGLTVFGMILVNSAAAMHYSAGAQVFPLLLHAQWRGLTLADLVFPGFLTMVGVAIPFALGGRAASADQVRRILARTGRLVLLGFVLSNLYWFQDFASGEWRLWGVLQRIGLVYGACALLFLTVGPRARAATIVAVLLLYWPLMLIAAPDGVPTDILLRGHNFAAYVDRLLSAPHIYVQGPEGYDPEGWLGTLPAIAHGLIGVAVGERLARRAGATRALLAAGAAMIAVGWLWSLAFPIIKDIWSSSFVLVTCGIAVVALAALHALIDREGARGPGPFATAMLAFGANAIAAYALHMLTAGMPAWDLLSLPYEASRRRLGEPLASLLPIGLYLLFIWACMEGLRRKGWILRI